METLVNLRNAKRTSGVRYGRTIALTITLYDVDTEFQESESVKYVSLCPLKGYYSGLAYIAARDYGWYGSMVSRPKHLDSVLILSLFSVLASY